MFQAVISREEGRKERGFRKKVREGVSKGIHHQKRFRKNAGTYLWCILRLELPGLNLRQGAETDIYLRQPLLKFVSLHLQPCGRWWGQKTRLWGVISRGSYIIDTVGSGRSKGEIYRGFHSGFGCRGEKLKPKNPRQNLKTLSCLFLWRRCTHLELRMQLRSGN